MRVVDAGVFLLLVCGTNQSLVYAVAEKAVDLINSGLEPDCLYLMCLLFAN